MGCIFSKLLSNSEPKPNIEPVYSIEPTTEEDEIYFTHETMSPATRPEVVDELIRWGLKEGVFKEIESGLYLVSRSELEQRLSGELSFEQGLGIWENGEMMYVCVDGKWEPVERTSG